MIWYPYAQMKTLKTPYKVIDAQGVYLQTQNKKLIDSMSSWWCMIHGYKNPELNEAMKAQIDRFSHCMLAGLAHESVEKLSEKLESYLPGDLNYYFSLILAAWALKLPSKWHFSSTKTAALSERKSSRSKMPITETHS